MSPRTVTLPSIVVIAPIIALNKLLCSYSAVPNTKGLRSTAYLSCANTPKNGNEIAGLDSQVDVLERRRLGGAFLFTPSEFTPSDLENRFTVPRGRKARGHILLRLSRAEELAQPTTAHERFDDGGCDHAELGGSLDNARSTSNEKMQRTIARGDCKSMNSAMAGKMMSLVSAWPVYAATAKDAKATARGTSAAIALLSTWGTP